MTRTSEIDVLILFAQEDATLRGELDKHLGPLERSRQIRAHHDEKLVPGENRVRALREHIERSEIVILLLSPDFLASPIMTGNEMRTLIRRCREGDTRIIPILLRPCNLTGLPFTDDDPKFLDLVVLPNNPSRPVTRWEDRDEAWTQVVAALREVLPEIEPRWGPPPPPASQTELATPSPLPPPSSPQTRDGRSEQHRRRWIVGVIGCLGAAVGALGIYFSSRSEPQSAQCPPGTTYLTATNGGRAACIDVKADVQEQNWGDAAAQCALMGGTLPTVDELNRLSQAHSGHSEHLGEWTSEKLPRDGVAIYKVYGSAPQPSHGKNRFRCVKAIK